MREDPASPHATTVILSIVHRHGYALESARYLRRKRFLIHLARAPVPMDIYEGRSAKIRNATTKINQRCIWDAQGMALLCGKLRYVVKS